MEDLEKDKLMSDVKFIAQHKTKGYTVEFTIDDFMGWDDEEIYFNNTNFWPEDEPKIPGFPYDDDFIFRLKRKDEVADIIPREFLSAEAVSDTILRIVYTNNVTEDYDFAGEEFLMDCELSSFILTKKDIRWISPKTNRTFRWEPCTLRWLKSNIKTNC